MTAKKPIFEKYLKVQVTYRPDQIDKVRQLQSQRLLSKLFQDALDKI